MKSLKMMLKYVLNKYNLKVLRSEIYDRMEKTIYAENDIALVLSLSSDYGFNEKLKDYYRISTSQLKQDLFVISHLNFKKNGFFVEFGATNGVRYSNTLLLERELGWKGILVEPGKIWHNELRTNRACQIDFNCVWNKTGDKMLFKEANNAELSTLQQYELSGLHSKERRGSKEYLVNTISLNDLLDKYNAPRNMDYLSIDTEGSELEILKELDFNRYNFTVITCEHNFGHDREKIYELLSRNGYIRLYEKISLFDDWYVKQESLPKLKLDKVNAFNMPT
jgi:FkbM family methyltransferase